MTLNKGQRRHTIHALHSKYLAKGFCGAKYLNWVLLAFKNIISKREKPQRHEKVS